MDTPSAGPQLTGSIFGVLSRCRGDHPALISPRHGTFSYTETRTAVLHLLQQLADLGMSPGDRIGIIVPDNFTLALTVLAVASGFTAAPLNPGYTEDEYRFYLSDLRARALIVSCDTPPAARVAAEALGIPTYLLSTGAKSLEIAGTITRTGRTVEPAGPQDIALVLHTSGTTARPKLVPLVHGRVCLTAANIAAALQLTPVDLCLNPMPMFHVHGIVNAMLSSFCAGATVACLSAFDTLEFMAAMEAFRPTWFTGVPTMHRSIVARARLAPPGSAAASLRFIRSSSAPMPDGLVRDLETLFRVPVIDSYGMTEVDQICVNPLPPAPRKLGSVGRPWETEVIVIGSNGEELPPGVPGEVCVRAPNVMPGYEDNPEANASAFYRGYFRTGDQGSFDEDGFLFLTGRLKEIINRGGEKIVPLEVDNALLACEGVREAATFAVPHPHLGEEVAAAVVLAPDCELTPAQIQEFAAARVAEFKVPRIVLPTPEIPKGPTGKLQRKNLAEHFGVSDFFQPENSAQGTPSARQEPRTQLEARLHSVWAQVLRAPGIGVRDDFVSMGGTSLQAAELFRHLELEFQRSIPLQVMLDCSTIEQMALSLVACGWEDSPLMAPAPEADP